MEIVNQIVPLILPIVLSLLAGFVIKKLNFSEGLAEATRDLMGGITDTYENYTKVLYKANGSLTEEEKQNARTAAWEKALSMASTKGKKFLLKLGKEKGASMINTIVQKFKKQ